MRGDPRTAADKTEFDKIESQCREALTPEAFAAAWEQGAALDADAASDWALPAWEQSASRFLEIKALD